MAKAQPIRINFVRAIRHQLFLGALKFSLQKHASRVLPAHRRVAR